MGDVTGYQDSSSCSAVSDFFPTLSGLLTVRVNKFFASRKNRTKPQDFQCGAHSDHNKTGRAPRSAYCRNTTPDSENQSVGTVYSLRINPLKNAQAR